MKNWTYFDRKERQGVCWLLAICFGSTLLPALMDQLLDWEDEFAKGNRQKYQALKAELEKDTFIIDSAKWVNYDPNVVDSLTLTYFGLQKKIISRWMKYRSKGGRFFQKEDVKKIYGLDSNLYSRMLPYIKIEPSKGKSTTKYRKDFKRKESIVYKHINVNKSTAKDWQQFRGIGPKISSRIIKFRSALGGFHSIDQIGETYGLSDSLFQMIKPYLKIEENAQKININQCSIEDLGRHPYIDWKLAKLIVRYREQHGPYKCLDSLKNIKILEEVAFQNIKKYLTITNQI